MLFPLNLNPHTDMYDPYSGGRQFGARRGQRKHAGIDLKPIRRKKGGQSWAEGLWVRTIAAGVLVPDNYERAFLVSDKKSTRKWKVFRLSIEHRGIGIVRYCEMVSLDGGRFPFKVGHKFAAGEVIGKLTRMNRSLMLHVEQYTGEAPPTTPFRNTKNPPYQRRSDHKDPTALVERLIAGWSEDQLIKEAP